MSHTLRVPDDCQDCGACCHGYGPRFVQVSGDDYERLGDAAAAATHFIGNRCYLRMVGQACAALKALPAGRYGCALYPTRPQPCRDLARGSPECLAVLERGPLEPTAPK